MATFSFGVGSGHLTAAQRRKAEALGADGVNYTDAQCNCGHGCPPHRCSKSRRHWFEIPNHGEPFNTRRANEILEAMGL